MNLKRIYEYALQREREGLEFFRSYADRMNHAVAAGIFKRLAAEEEKHIQYIERLLAGLESRDDPPALPDPSDFGMFEERTDAEKLDQTVLEAMTPDVTILRTAYLIERDFAEFYEMAAGRAEGDAREALLALAEWERGHERLFKDLHDQVFEEYAQMPWGG